ncbi:LysR family transcriptional regulator [Mesobacterium pallidum]|uniref:LysR family transcriptional regulator n=1 Tax=Mesobacterium pallidum TaxID=2872037 RepID=UPI001EE1E77A|nr:LysR family transcriptional regulator [Mesobacterium pallidum]
MTINLKHLEVLHAVVVAGGIGKATRLTGLSQPTISQQIAKFEEELGCQLLLRKRSKAIELTAAGEFWFRTAKDVLGRMTEAEETHRNTFGTDRLAIRVGTPPSLRGHFIEGAARIALQQGKFSRFEFVWGIDSEEIVEMMETRKINCAVVSAASVEDRGNTLAVERLFTDQIVWVVPASVPEESVAAVLRGDAPGPEADALKRYVDVTTSVVPWHGISDTWFREHLPFALPYFSCMTHQAAVDITAGGIATCHCPVSLIPNLSDQMRSRIRTYALNEVTRDAVFCMPRHLLSLKPFAEFQKAICGFMRDQYDNGRVRMDLLPLPV